MIAKYYDCIIISNILCDIIVSYIHRHIKCLQYVHGYFTIQPVYV